MPPEEIENRIDEIEIHGTCPGVSDKAPRSVVGAADYSDYPSFFSACKCGVSFL